jgi:voltage-gated potassium channel Kch
MTHSAEVIRIARELNPDIRVLARANYLADRLHLLHAGANEVFSAEGEVALAFSVAILRRLGATPEQIDRERQWVYADLLGQPLLDGPSDEGLQDSLAPTAATPPAVAIPSPKSDSTA